MANGEQRFTRRNTAPGSVERRAVYKAEYEARQSRAQALGVTYAQARQLRSLFPLSAPIRAQLHANKQNVGQMHTQYAVIRARIAIAERDAGKRISARQRQAIRAYGRERGAGPDPVAALAGWYRSVQRADYNPADFPGTAPVPTATGGGAGLAGEEWEEAFYIEDYYDIEWTDLDEWDVWDFVFY